jgi:branched-chain amino acid transport system substrate-binding protein
MQHKMKQLAGAALAAAMSLAGTAHAQQVEDVKVGFAGPMTGAQAHYGKDFQNGITLAVEEENASKPVIGGKQVRFVPG